MKAKEITEAPFSPYKFHDPITTRSKNVPQLRNAEKFAEFISTHCSEMVAAYKSSRGYLYRGINSPNPVVYTNIRPDRKPVEMDPRAHEILHKAYLDLGLTATRTNAIFCTANARIAETWGNQTAIVFVTNGWSGTVFKHVQRDYSYYPLSNAAYEYGYATRKNNSESVREEAYATLLRRIEALGPTNFNTADELSGILRNKVEDILITGKSYVGLCIKNEDLTLANNILQLLKLRPAR